MTQKDKIYLDRLLSKGPVSISIYCSEDNANSAINDLSRKSVNKHWRFRHAFATNVTAALLWPGDASDGSPVEKFDPHLMETRRKVRDRLVGAQSLGLLSLHSIALLMGHTAPSRTRYSYTHHIEAILGAHVDRRSTRQHAWRPEIAA